MKAVYLYPKSSYVTELRSDTLWGLILVAIRYVFSENKLLELLEKYLKNKPPFVVSSAFPFKMETDGTKIHFFPKPIWGKGFKVKTTDFNALEIRKKLKKVKSLPQNIFEEFINGEITDESFIAKYSGNNVDNLESLENIIPKILDYSTVHNRIDLLKGTTMETEEGGQLFLTHEFFVQKGGLFFLIEGEDISYLEAALRFLSHFGFGGDHSTGKGAFDFEIKDFSIRVPQDPYCFVTLSLFNPTPEELNYFKSDADKFWYELVQRNGIIGAQFKRAEFRKKSFFAFAEGSTFPIIEGKKYYGRILKTMDEPSAYSNCLAFAIQAKFTEV
ncbi:MAG: type III-A CRISPR-associated RAMP protein Csm4 [Ignavibacteria bacterium]|nr:type III-A CRISPR-associated RAMP protein Csm4 [Ignavibacteria bacterium]